MVGTLSVSKKLRLGHYLRVFDERLCEEYAHDTSAFGSPSSEGEKRKPSEQISDGFSYIFAYGFIQELDPIRNRLCF